MLTDGDVTLSDAMSKLPSLVANYVWQDELIHMITTPKVLNTGQLPPSWFRKLYDNHVHNQEDVVESYRIHRAGRHVNSDNMTTLTEYFRLLYKTRTPHDMFYKHWDISPIPAIALFAFVDPLYFITTRAFHDDGYLTHFAKHVIYIIEGHAQAQAVIQGIDAMKDEERRTATWLKYKSLEHQADQCRKAVSHYLTALFRKFEDSGITAKSIAAIHDDLSALFPYVRLEILFRRASEHLITNCADFELMTYKLISETARTVTYNRLSALRMHPAIKAATYKPDNKTKEKMTAVSRFESCIGYNGTVYVIPAHDVETSKAEPYTMLPLLPDNLQPYYCYQASDTPSAAPSFTAITEVKLPSITPASDSDALSALQGLQLSSVPTTMATASVATASSVFNTAIDTKQPSDHGGSHNGDSPDRSKFLSRVTNLMNSTPSKPKNKSFRPPNTGPHGVSFDPDSRRRLQESYSNLADYETVQDWAPTTLHDVLIKLEELAKQEDIDPKSMFTDTARASLWKHLQSPTTSAAQTVTAAVLGTNSQQPPVTTVPTTTPHPMQTVLDCIDKRKPPNPFLGSSVSAFTTSQRLQLPTVTCTNTLAAPLAATGYMNIQHVPLPGPPAASSIHQSVPSSSAPTTALAPEVQALVNRSYGPQSLPSHATQTFGPPSLPQPGAPAATAPVHPSLVNMLGPASGPTRPTPPAAGPPAAVPFEMNSNVLPRPPRESIPELSDASVPTFQLQRFMGLDSPVYSPTMTYSIDQVDAIMRLFTDLNFAYMRGLLGASGKDTTILQMFSNTPLKLATKYDGNPKYFTAFLTVYAEKIYANPKLSDAEKGRGLLMNLTGPPYQIFGKWNPTVSNLPALLLQFFNIYFKPTIATQRLLDDLRSVPAITGSDSKSLGPMIALQSAVHSLYEHCYKFDQPFFLRYPDYLSTFRTKIRDCFLQEWTVWWIWLCDQNYHSAKFGQTLMHKMEEFMQGKVQQLLMLQADEAAQPFQLQCPPANTKEPNTFFYTDNSSATGSGVEPTVLQYEDIVANTSKPDVDDDQLTEISFDSTRTDHVPTPQEANHLHMTSNGVLCRFCSRAHPTERCFQFFTPLHGNGGKYSIAYDAGLCYQCLGKFTDGHRDNCKSLCKSCGKKHHVTLCDTEQRKWQRNQPTRNYQPRTPGVRRPPYEKNLSRPLSPARNRADTLKRYGPSNRITDKATQASRRRNEHQRTRPKPSSNRYRFRPAQQYKTTVATRRSTPPPQTQYRSRSPTPTVAAGSQRSSSPGTTVKRQSSPSPASNRPTYAKRYNQSNHFTLADPSTLPDGFREAFLDNDDGVQVTDFDDWSNNDAAASAYLSQAGRLPYNHFAPLDSNFDEGYDDDVSLPPLPLLRNIPQPKSVPQEHKMPTVFIAPFLTHDHTTHDTNVMMDNGADRTFSSDQYHPTIMVKRLSDIRTEPMHTSGGTVPTKCYMAVFYATDLCRTVLIAITAKVIDKPPFPSPLQHTHPMAAHEPTLNSTAPFDPIMMLMGATDFTRITIAHPTVHGSYTRFQTLLGTMFMGSHNPEEDPQPPKSETRLPLEAPSTTYMITEEENNIDTPEFSASQQQMLENVISYVDPYDDDSDADEDVAIPHVFATAAASMDDGVNQLINVLVANDSLPEDHKTGLTSDQLAAKQMMDEEITLVTLSDGRRMFKTPMLIKPDAEIPNNFARARAVWNTQCNKMQRENAVVRAGLFQKMMDQFHAYESIYEIDPDSPHTDDAFYCSFKLVLKPSSTSSPERLTMNASLGPRPLNVFLYQCPNLLPPIFNQQVLFRTAPIMVLADVSKMFLSVLLDENAHKYTRILYRHPLDPTAPTKTYQFRSLCWGTSTAPYCAMRALQQAFLEELKDPKISPMRKRVCQTAPAHFYVDDISLSFHQVQDAVDYCKELIAVLARYNFTIKKFVSNNADVLRQLPEDCLATPTASATRQTIVDDSARQLGYEWLPGPDLMVFQQYPNLPKSYVGTKRSLLSTLSSLFDPLGLLGPYILRARQLFQKALLHEPPLAWDDSLTKISQGFADDCQTWVNGIAQLNTIQFPRPVTINADSRLIFFGDASRDGIGCAVYVLSTHEGVTTSNFLLGRAKSSPVTDALKTIPKLELRSIHLSAVIATILVPLLNIDKSRCHFFTDSISNVYWAAQDPSHTITFVKNRVQLLKDNKWDLHWCSTTVNPADLFSRGCLDPAELTSDLTLHGPPFLVETGPEGWPKSPTDWAALKDTSSCFLKKFRPVAPTDSAFLTQYQDPIDFSEQLTVHPAIDDSADSLYITFFPNNSQPPPRSTRLDTIKSNDLAAYKAYFAHDPIPVIGSDDFNSYFNSAAAIQRYIGILYYILDHWIAFARSRQEQRGDKRYRLLDSQTSRYIPRPVLKDLPLYLHPRYLLLADALCVLQAQRRFYHQDYQRLLRCLPVAQKSPLRKLRPFLDSRLCIRLSGRLQKCLRLPYEERHVLLLPPQTSYAHCLLFDAHRAAGHKQVNFLRGTLNRTYHIPNMDHVFQPLLDKCQLCIMRTSKPATCPMGQWPREKYESIVPNYSVTCDMAGPIWIKADKTDGQTDPVPLKCYLYVWVCNTTRFTHISVVTSASTQDFLAAYLHLIAVGGEPTYVYTDAQKCFVQIARLLDGVGEADPRHDHSPFICPDMDNIFRATTPAQWTISPPKAAWKNANSERMIQTIKQSMKKCLTVDRITVDSKLQPVFNVNLTGFKTLIDRLSITINDRPITVVKGFPHLLITPSRLSRLRCLKALPTMVTDLPDCPPPSEHLTAKLLTELSDQFTEDLRSMMRETSQKEHKWFKDPDTPKLKRGDLVFVPPSLAEERRSLFLPAWVTKVLPSADSQQRMVQVYCPGLRTPTGSSPRTNYRTLDIRHICPTGITTGRPRLQFNNRVSVRDIPKEPSDTTALSRPYHVNLETGLEFKADHNDLALPADYPGAYKPPAHVDQLLAQPYSDVTNPSGSDGGANSPRHGGASTPSSRPPSPSVQPLSDDDTDDLDEQPVPLRPLVTRSGRHVRIPSRFRDN